MLDISEQTNDMSSTFSLKNTPNSQEIWKGIGGHFDFLSQIIHEFIDNSISNIKGHQLSTKSIEITFTPNNNKNIQVTIEDQGTGINDLDGAFCLGNKSSKQSPLNEHGFGMKHALASANPDNNNWAVYTRTIEDFRKNEFKKIESPYQIVNYSGTLVTSNDGQWPGTMNGSGTLVTFECPWDMFVTLRKGISGPNPNSIDYYMTLFKEDLGFVYADILTEGNASITIRTPTKNYNVTPVIPKWVSAPKEKKENYDLGKGDVLFNCQIGSIEDGGYSRYYGKNQSSSGLEIRINGRLLSYNIFKDVWKLEPHPTYNHLLVKLNIISQDGERLPATRTSKNGLREGDGKLEKIYEWVRRKYPTPEKGEDMVNEDEISLFERLKDLKNSQLEGEYATTQQTVFRSIKDKARIDLFVNYKNEITIYEGKKEHTTYKDVYQLRMYWDGCVIDEIRPQRGILIANYHPESVKELVNIVNIMQDAEGNNYNFVLKTWIDEQIVKPIKG